MPAANFSDTASQIVKKFYADGLHPQYIDEHPLLSKIPRDKTDIGEDYTFTVSPEGAQGIGNRAEGGAMPTPGRVQLTRGLWTPKSIYGRVQITGKAVRRTRNDKRAIANLVRVQTDTTLKRLAKDMNFQLYRTGSGLRSILNGALTASSSAVTVTVADAATLYGIYQGMTIDFYGAGGTTPLETDVLVTSVNRNAGTFVIESLSVNIPDASEVYRNGNYNEEFLGLNGYINNTSGPATVLGIASSNAYWQGNVLANGGTARPLTLELMEQARQAAMIQNNMEPDYYFMDFTQYRKLQALLTRVVEYKSEGALVKTNGGHIVPAYGAGEVVRDSDMLPQVIFATQMKEDIRLGDDFPLQWQDMDNTLWKYVQGFDLWEAVCVYDGNLYGHRRNLHSKLMDLEG